MTVCHWSAKDPLSMLHVLYHPVDGVSLGSLADVEHEAYQELAVAKDPDWELEVRLRVK